MKIAVSHSAFLFEVPTFSTHSPLRLKAHTAGVLGRRSLVSPGFLFEHHEMTTTASPVTSNLPSAVSCRLERGRNISSAPSVPTHSEAMSCGDSQFPSHPLWLTVFRTMSHGRRVKTPGLSGDTTPPHNDAFRQARHRPCPCWSGRRGRAHSLGPIALSLPERCKGVGSR